MNNPIVFAVIVLGVLGLAGSLILVLASKFMAVYEDPRIAEITGCLAGANCGGCGYAGCADYAKAIVEDGAPTFKCAPGGDKAADAINRIMGAEESDRPPPCAPLSAATAAPTAASGLIIPASRAAPPRPAWPAAPPPAPTAAWATATVSKPVCLARSACRTAWPLLTAPSAPAAPPAPKPAPAAC